MPRSSSSPEDNSRPRARRGSRPTSDKGLETVASSDPRYLITVCAGRRAAECSG